MSEQSTPKLPEWDMTPFFPGLDSAEFQLEFAAVVREIHEVAEQFDRDDIDGTPASGVPQDTIEVFERTVINLNHVLDRMRVVGAYLSAFVSVDSRNDNAQTLMSAYQSATIAVPTLMSRFTAWIGAVDYESIIVDSKIAAEHDFMVRKCAIGASHLMSGPEEQLASELTLSGSRAWNRLHGDVSSQIMVEVEGVGKLPMSAARNLAYSPDLMIREASYRAELEAWERNKIPVAAAFNGIKGEVVTLCRRRKWISPLEESLHENHIDPEVLNAMLGSARRSYPMFRRYLLAKAKVLGTDRITWYDLFAPIDSKTRLWSWDEARAFILETFGTYSIRLQDYARRAFDEHWIDAPSTDGKRDGAFCMRVRGEESRILTNFKPTINGVSTLAHELGHGYHNLNLAQRSYLQRDTPMTLAETASIFCETIVRNAGLIHADPLERMGILEASLQGACQIVVDISSRLFFEQEALKSRASRALQPDELCEIMLRAQDETYGEALLPEKRHPYMWAAKPHYYSTESYYNYPYMFGMLFGLGLYARYEADPPAFRQDYDELLSWTGMADAETLAKRFGIDIKSEEFWDSSLTIIERDINLFVTATHSSQPMTQGLTAA